MSAHMSLCMSGYAHVVCEYKDKKEGERQMKGDAQSQQSAFSLVAQGGVGVID